MTQKTILGLAAILALTLISIAGFYFFSPKHTTEKTVPASCRAKIVCIDCNWAGTYCHLHAAGGYIAHTVRNKRVYPDDSAAR